MRSLGAGSEAVTRDAHGTEHEDLVEPPPTNVPGVAASMRNERLGWPRAPRLEVKHGAHSGPLGELHPGRTANLATTYPYRASVVAAVLPQHLLNQPAARLWHTRVPWSIHLDHSFVTPAALGCVDAGIDGTVPQEVPGTEPRWQSCPSSGLPGPRDSALAGLAHGVWRGGRRRRRGLERGSRR